MLEKMKIMVVDDNTVNLATVEQDLKDKYEVIPMISGRRAVKYLYRDRVDLILLDVQMPIMDGIETLREIRTQPNGITVPVIFLTSRNDKGTVIEGSKLGIMDYITKPFEADDLQNRIERVFKRLGMLPMSDEELFFRMKEIVADLKDGKNKKAIFEMDEVLGYQINDDISGRIKNARMKMEDGSVDGALSMVERVVAMLDRVMANSGRVVAMPISNGEINARLLYILDDLANFKIREAMAKVTDLKKYEVPEFLNLGLDEVKKKLDEYDDVEAEAMVKDLLEKLKKPEAVQSQNLKKNGEEEDAKQSSGYHYSRLL